MTELYLKASDVTIKRGQHVNVAASDSIVTGLLRVDSCVATMDDDPEIGAGETAFVTCVKPAAGGTITIKSWQDSVAAASAGFGRKINWVAVGPGP